MAAKSQATSARRSRARGAPKLNTPGRPSLIYDRHIVETFLKSVLKGNWRSTAARVAGISEGTVRDWLDRGEAVEAAAMERIRQAGGIADAVDPDDVPEADRVYLIFLKDFRRADASAEDRIVGGLSLQAATSPVASMGMLKMRWPKNWREAPSQVEVSGPGGGPIALSPVLAKLTDDELEARIKALEAEIEGTE